MKTTFELNDTLFVEAELEETDTVYLWLGVGIVLNCFLYTQIKRSLIGERDALIQIAGCNRVTKIEAHDRGDEFKEHN